MLCEYSYKNYGSLAQIHNIMAEIQHFFLGDYFLLVHPVEAKAGEHHRLSTRTTYCTGKKFKFLRIWACCYFACFIAVFYNVVTMA